MSGLNSAAVIASERPRALRVDAEKAPRRKGSNAEKAPGTVVQAVADGERFRAQMVI